VAAAHRLACLDRQQQRAVRANHLNIIRLIADPNLRLTDFQRQPMRLDQSTQVAAHELLEQRPLERTAAALQPRQHDLGDGRPFPTTCFRKEWLHKLADFVQQVRLPLDYRIARDSL
jgi:hypothetical protein